VQNLHIILIETFFTLVSTYQNTTCVQNIFISSEFYILLIMTLLEFILEEFSMCSPCYVADVWHHLEPYTLFNIFWVLAYRYHLPGRLKTVFPQPVDQEVEFYSFCINTLPNIVTL
jgi:hypothetical protein